MKAWLKTLRGEEARELWELGMYEYEASVDRKSSESHKIPRIVRVAETRWHRTSTLCDGEGSHCPEPRSWGAADRWFH
jgi:hypothetical protein